MLAGALYLIWDAFAYGAYFGQKHGEPPNAIVSLHAFQGLLLSLAGALTYVATAAFALSLARTEWLSRKASRAYIIVSMVAFLLIVIKIQQRLDPAAVSVPWYAFPGFVLGIPALPLIMSSLLGAGLLRRAGDEKYWGEQRGT